MLGGGPTPASIGDLFNGQGDHCGAFGHSSTTCGDGRVCLPSFGAADIGHVAQSLVEVPFIALSNLLPQPTARRELML
jgi:hypothetical protein